MVASDLMLVFVAAGVATTCGYLFSEFMSWQTIKAAEVRAAVVLRDLYRKLHAKTKPYLDRRKKIRPPSAH